jgi:DNA-binding CsgD family transcriptional regulator
VALDLASCAGNNRTTMQRSARPRFDLAAVVRRCAAFDGDLRARIGVPVISVLVTVLAIDFLRAVFPAGGVFLLLLIPVLVASVAFGARSGLLALSLGMAGALGVAAVRAHPWLADPADLLRVVPYVCIGGFIVLVGEVLRASVRRRSQSQITGPPGPVALVEPLTERELEVLGLAASGLKTDEIAAGLVVSRNTVKSHLGHAYGKLGVRNRAEAVAVALHSGAIDPAVVTSRVEVPTKLDVDRTPGAVGSPRQPTPLHPAIGSGPTH